MKTMYFTFGQNHIHYYGDKILNKDTVVKITAIDPLEVMFKTFGGKWSRDFDSPPDMSFYPKGIIEIH